MKTATVPDGLYSTATRLQEFFWARQSLSSAEESLSSAEERTSTNTPATLGFRREVADFQRAVGRSRDQARSAIVRKLLTADNPDEYIETLLHVLVSSALPGRLDDAVDVLSECGPVLPHFVVELLSQPLSSLDEDFWYALIRGIGKSAIPSVRIYVELLWSKSPEAAVEALGDIGDNDSLNRLRAVANDESNPVRELAASIIEECFE